MIKELLMMIGALTLTILFWMFFWWLLRVREVVETVDKMDDFMAKKHKGWTSFKYGLE